MKIPKTPKPCKQCPYKKGLVKFVTNPCPECIANGYNTYYETLSKVNNPFAETINLKDLEK
jgi:pyruvate formate-lyase activating enzyme-like uncharacterized protein